METDEEDLAMETAREYLARPLPALINSRGESPDLPSERITAEFSYQWVPFESEVTTALQGPDLTRQVPQPGLTGTVEYYHWKQVGLSGRLTSNACDHVVREMYQTDLQNVTFGDLGCIRGPTIPGIPGISIIHLRDADP